MCQRRKPEASNRLRNCHMLEKGLPTLREDSPGLERVTQRSHPPTLRPCLL